MEVTRPSVRHNTRFTSRTKIIAVRFPLSLAEKLSAHANASALIVAATATALQQRDSVTAMEAAPAR